MTKVKICGLKCENDIDYVNELMPDYVGFVFAKSKRQVDKFKAKQLIEKLDKKIKKVGVFLNRPLSELNEIAEFCELDIVQLHGDEPAEYCNQVNHNVWKAFRIKTAEDMKHIHQYDIKGCLLDTYVKDAYGGTGEVFNWDVASHISKENFVILAGGLKEDNIEKAIQTVRPQVVDVSSGVETDGYKDFEKMKRFIERVRKLND